MKKILLISLLFIMLLSIVFAVGCKKSEPDPEYVIVTFVDWDGRIIQANKILKGATPVAPTGLTRPTVDGISYKFIGWSDSIEEVTENITVTAVYQPSKKYRVFFMLDDQVIYTVTSGDYFSIPTPEKEGFVFDGWYTDKEFTEKAPDNYAFYRYLTEDMYVYAKMVSL